MLALRYGVIKVSKIGIIEKCIYYNKKIYIQFYNMSNYLEFISKYGGPASIMDIPEGVEPKEVKVCPFM